MIRIGLLHEVPRVRALYEAVLVGRGHAVVVGSLMDPTAIAIPTSGRDWHDCDLLVVHVPDGQQGLDRLAALHSTVPVVCIDDDTDPARERWLAAHGFEQVLHGPIRLRDLVEAIEVAITKLQAPRWTADQTVARVVHDSRERAGRSLDKRGHAPRAGRHLLLEADALQVAIHLFPRDTRLRLVGTVAGTDEPVLARVGLAHGSAIGRTRTDVAGRFEFGDVVPGPARLRVDGRGWAIDAAVALAID